jgi:hypothetical protein
LHAAATQIGPAQHPAAFNTAAKQPLRLLLLLVLQNGAKQHCNLPVNGSYQVAAYDAAPAVWLLIYTAAATCAAAATAALQHHSQA